MKDLFEEKYNALMRLEENDPEYASIFADFRVAEANYLALYREMTPQQQEVLTEFIGRLSELHQRELQLIFLS